MNDTFMDVIRILSFYLLAFTATMPDNPPTIAAKTKSRTTASAVKLPPPKIAKVAYTTAAHKTPVSAPLKSPLSPEKEKKHPTNNEIAFMN